MLFCLNYQVNFYLRFSFISVSLYQAKRGTLLNFLMLKMESAHLKIGHLEDEAVKRRDKLKALKRKRETKGIENVEQPANTVATPLPKPLFRSYKPSNEELNDFLMEQSTPGDVSAEVQEQLEAAKSGIVIDQLDVTSLAPRKPDWDLKRDVAKKLAKLEKQTQKAIAELIRDRLKERSKTEDLAAMVNSITSDS